jgi:hypothetical protein
MLIEIRKPSYAPSLPVTGQWAHSHIPNMTFKRSFTKAANIYINQQTNLMRMEESLTNKTMHHYDLIDFHR